MPKGRVIAGKGGGRISFQLFDNRKRFNLGPPRKPYAKVRPRIWSLEPEPDPPPTYFRPWPAASPEPVPALEPVPEPAKENDGGAHRLRLRLTAVKMALDDIPRQAQRMARWTARCEKMENPKFKSPLRQGPPPGHRKKPEEDIDFLLEECHALARDALSQDTS